MTSFSHAENCFSYDTLSVARMRNIFQITEQPFLIHKITADQEDFYCYT